MNCTYLLEPKNRVNSRELSKTRSNQGCAKHPVPSKYAWMAAMTLAWGLLFSSQTSAQTLTFCQSDAKKGSTYSLTSSGTAGVGGCSTSYKGSVYLGSTIPQEGSDGKDQMSYVRSAPLDGTLELVATKEIKIEGQTSFKGNALFNGYRVSNIGDATEDGDAINLGQLKKIGLVNDFAEFLSPVIYDDPSLTRITFNGSAKGIVLANVAPGLISQDSKEAINGGQLFALQGRVEVLENQSPGGGGGGGGGGGQVVNDDHQGAAPGSLDIGKGNSVTADNGIVHGNDNKVTGNHGIGIGNGTQVSGRQAIAMGTSAQASGNNSVAIGQGARATANDAVALGSGSLADRDNTVSVGAAGRERQITNVAAATQRTDAANWGQVQDAVGQVRGAMDGLRDWADRRFDKLDRRINAMGAVSAANAQMAINAGGVQPGKGRFAAGVGFASGERALAVGYAKAITERVRFSIGGSTGSSQTSAGIGIGVDL